MKRVHFVGIAGIGMSALADILISKGLAVSGSDLRQNNLTEKLSMKGARIFSGHDRRNIHPSTDLVITTNSIRRDNPELMKAKELGIPVKSRSELLKDLFDGAGTTVAVTGTHGKTTTTSLIGFISESCGKDPTVIVGGELDCFGGNVKYGRDDLIISEVDESDGHFRNLRAKYAVITNAEREHMEYYGSMENLIASYKAFVSNIPPDGLLVWCGEDKNLAAIAARAACRKLSYGIDGPFDYSCRNIEHAKRIQFDLARGGKVLGRLDSTLIGKHNVLNIAGAAALCLELGMEFRHVSDALRRFKNARRRFELKDLVGGVSIIEDYAHHPTEIRSVISAAGGAADGRVIVVFQPHRYTRTSDMAEEFAGCFYGANVLVLTDVYSADEEPVTGRGIKDIYEKIDKTRFEGVDFLRKEDIAEHVGSIARENDMVIIMGAGDIRELVLPISRTIRRRIRHDG